MLNPSELKFRVPTHDPERLANSLWGSYSLSACCAALFEVDELPTLFEEAGFEWNPMLGRWSESRGFQLIQLPMAFPLRGYHLRIMLNPETEVRYADETTGPALEAAIFHGEVLVFNPSGLTTGLFHDTRMCWIAHDPASIAHRFN